MSPSPTTRCAAAHRGRRGARRRVHARLRRADRGRLGRVHEPRTARAAGTRRSRATCAWAAPSRRPPSARAGSSRCEPPRLLTAVARRRRPGARRDRAAPVRGRQRHDRAGVRARHDVGHPRDRRPGVRRGLLHGRRLQPRLVTLDWHLRGTLPDDLDPTRLHLREDLRPAIEGSMAALDELLGADKRGCRRRRRRESRRGPSIRRPLRSPSARNRTCRADRPVRQHRRSFRAASAGDRVRGRFRCRVRDGEIRSSRPRSRGNRRRRRGRLWRAPTG